MKHRGEYRPGRVRVTTAIRDQVYELVKQEDDVHRKHKHPAKWYRNEADTILDLDEDSNPSLRSYEDLLGEAREYYKKPLELDRPWDVLDCLTFPIPGRVFDEMMKLQGYLLGRKKHLTVRRARDWAMLFPKLWPLLEETYGEDDAQNRLRLMQIAAYYGRLQQRAERTGSGEPADVSELDRDFLINRDVSGPTLRKWWASIFSSTDERKRPEDVADYQTQILNELTDEQRNLFRQFLSTLVSALADAQKWNQVDFFLANHPEIQIPAETFMVLSTRRDIANLQRRLEEEKNDGKR